MQLPSPPTTYTSATLPVVGGLWRGATATIVALGTITALLMGGVAASVVLVLTSNLQQGLTEELLLAAVSNPVFLTTLVSTQSLVMLLFVRWAMRRNQVSWHAIGLRPASAPWLIGAASLALPLLVFRLVTVIAIAIGLQAVTNINLLEASENTLDTQLLAPTGSAATILIAIVMVSVVVPVMEELVFRGVIHSALRNRLRFWPAAIISGVLFGVFHLNPLQALAAAVLGVVCAWLYERSESLWPAIALHGVNNFLAQGLVYLALLMPPPA